MTKAELIEVVAKDAGCLKKDVTSVLASLTKTIQTADKVALVGFGVFSRKNKPARVGRNPQTGLSVQIAAKTVLAFKASALPVS